MPDAAYESPETEFWYNVSRQEDLPIAGEIEGDIKLEEISRLFSSLKSKKDAKDKKFVLSDEIFKQPTIFSSIRQFLGISDKRV